MDTFLSIIRSRTWRLEWILLLALLTAGVLAGGSLLALKRQHERRARVAATETVLNDGAALLDAFCSAGLMTCSTNTPSPSQWRSFSARVDSAFAVRTDVQSVSVTRDGVTLFHRQAGGLLPPSGDARQGENVKAPRTDLLSAETEMKQGSLETDGKRQPVFVITRTQTLKDGAKVVVEATFKREAVGAEEQTARQLVASLFTFSFVVLVVAFVACALVLSLAVIRDRRREEKERREEHLAFSGVLANGILHDFRNPMSAVRLDAQMLCREMKRDGGFRPERVTELSGRIARTMERMDKIFTEFLFLAKPAGEKPESIDLSAAARECLDTLAPRLEQAGLTAVSVLPEEPICGLAYSAPFRRALMNVLVNATQFAPRGSVIRVRLSAEGERAVLEVHDDGPGIPPKMREKVFEMFVTGRPEGTGLGLFLARTAIQRCGGSICVAEGGPGTTFRMEVPYAG